MKLAAKIATGLAVLGLASTALATGTTASAPLPAAQPPAHGSASKVSKPKHRGRAVAQAEAKKVEEGKPAAKTPEGKPHEKHGTKAEARPPAQGEKAKAPAAAPVTKPATTPAR